MKKFINKIFLNRFIQGGMILTLTNLFVGFLNYLFNSFSGKLLGPEKYSEISALFSYLIIFAVPSSVIHSEIIRRLGYAGKNRFQLIKSWYEWYRKITRKWNFLLIFFVPFFIFIIPPLTNLSLIYSFTLMILLLMTFFSMFYTSTLLGLHLFFLYSTVLILSTLTKLIGPLLVYSGIDGATTIAIFIMLSSVILVIVSKINLESILKKIKTKYGSNKRLHHVLFNRQIVILALSAVSILLINNLDVIFVKKFYSAKQAGVYGAWNLFSKMIYYLLSPILSMTYIFFTSKEEEQKHLLVFVINTILLLISGALLFLIYSFGGKLLISLIFNEKYASIIPILPQASIFGVLFVAINFFNSYFIAKKSLIALTTLPFIPFYALSLLLFGKTIESVVKINLWFSAVITLSYLVLFIVKLYSHPKSSQRLLTV